MVVSVSAKVETLRQIQDDLVSQLKIQKSVEPRLIGSARLDSEKIKDRLTNLHKSCDTIINFYQNLPKK